MPKIKFTIDTNDLLMNPEKSEQIDAWLLKEILFERLNYLKSIIPSGSESSNMSLE